MTREEEIKIAAKKRSDWHQTIEEILNNHNSRLYLYDKIYNSEIESFKAGVKWADKNPQSPWISVKDDLPCNHEELLHPLYANFTKDVLVIFENKYISLERMIKDDKGNWKFVGNVLYWIPIPELPKE